MRKVNRLTIKRKAKELSESVPSRFVVTIGGFFGRHHEVRWRRGQLWYRTDEMQTLVVPTSADWQNFWATIERIGVWGWEAGYDDLETLDGCQWSLAISYGSRRLKCYGSNLFPGQTDLERARPFQQFLDAVALLVQQPFGG
jgi:hypothetical protein